MKIIIIAAVAKNGVIGNNDKLCWHIPEDMKRFRELTVNNVVIFGRKTWESLPNKPLPARINIVLTRDKNLINQSQDSSFIATSNITDTITSLLLSSSIKLGRKLYICGGAKVYEHFLSLADEMQLTFVNQESEGDTYFPQWDRFKHLSEWDKDYEFITIKKD